MLVLGFLDFPNFWDPDEWFGTCFAFDGRKNVCPFTRAPLLPLDNYTNNTFWESLMRNMVVKCSQSVANLLPAVFHFTKKNSLEL